jgi:methionine aminopeptidase
MTSTAIAPAAISPRRDVPASIARPEYVDKPGPAPFTGSEVKDAETIAKIRVACRLAAQARELVGSHVAPGVTTDELDRAIKAVRPGRRVSVIGRVIESYARRFGYGVVREFTGHGIGTSFHSGLIIPHYDEPRFDDEILPGMTFTIEPMLNLGTHEWVMWDDGWTVVTADGRRSAQFEHTLLVTADGAEVLTIP